MRFFAQVELELKELQNLGIEVPQAAFKLLKTENEEEYSHMKVSEAADLIFELSLFNN